MLRARQILRAIIVSLDVKSKRRSTKNPHKERDLSLLSTVTLTLTGEKRSHSIILDKILALFYSDRNSLGAKRRTRIPRFNT